MSDIYLNIETSNPRVYDLGIEDKPGTTTPYVSPLPTQHCPLIHFFSGKGKVGRQLVNHDGVMLTTEYGITSRSVNDQFTTHSTPYLLKTIANANSAVLHRLVPPDAKDVANVSLWLDVLKCDVPVYQKRSDGSEVLDATGLPVPEVDGTGAPVTVEGYKVMWVKDHTSVTVGTYQPGQLTQRTGIQTEGSEVSTQYPIFEAYASDFGDRGNLLGIRMFAHTRKEPEVFPEKILRYTKNFPYYFGVVEMTDETTGLVKRRTSRFSSTQVRFVNELDCVNPITNDYLDFKYVVDKEYLKIKTSARSGVGGVYAYNDNIHEVLGLLYEAEAKATDAYSDTVITPDEDNRYTINFMSFVNSNGSPYQSIKLVDEVGSIRLTRNTNIFFDGSSNGTMDNDTFEALVGADMENYADDSHYYQDYAGNPESIYYDSGFSLDVKEKIACFIAKRHDTFVVMGTHVHGETLSIEDQTSLGTSIKSMLELYPESLFFETPVVRGMIMMGSGKIIGSNYRSRVSTNYELLDKASKYMGAQTGKWKNGYLFDEQPRSLVETLEDIDYTWVSPASREEFWSIGMNFILKEATNRFWIPGLRTIYYDQTSILISFFNVMAICYVNKIGHAVWRRHSGSVGKKEAEFVLAVENTFNNYVTGAFDNLIAFKPVCKITEGDSERGYSWTLHAKAIGRTMKTVQTLYVTSYHEDRLQEGDI